MYGLLMLVALVAASSLADKIELRQSGDQEVKVGQTLNLICTISGIPIATEHMFWQWVQQPAGKQPKWLGWIYPFSGSKYKDASLRDRIELSADTSKNEVSLQISSLTVHDSATYYCTRNWFDYWGPGTSVTVSPASPSAPTLFPLIPSGCLSDSEDVTIGCMAKDYLPDSITFSWNDQNNASLEANKFKKYPSALNPDGKFTTSTQASIPKTDWESYAPFYCKAGHLGVDKVARVTRSSKGCGGDGPPETEMIMRAPPLQAFQSAYLNSTITCTATHLISMKATLQWFKDGEELDSGFTTSKPSFDAHNGNSITSELVVTKKDWLSDKKFSCRVENEKYNNTLVIHKSAYGQGPVNCDDVQVETIPPSYAEIHLKQQATLTCRISNIPFEVDLAALNVTWTQKRDNKVLPTVIKKPQEQENDKQTIDVTATTCTTDWNRGDIFICKVALAGLLPIPIEKTLQKVTGGSVSPPTVYILPPPPEQLALRESATLTCLIKNFSPKDIYVRWLRGDQPVSDEHFFTSTPRKESSSPERYTAYSTLNINEEDWNSGNSYSCLVGHEGLPLNTTQKTIDKNTGKPTHVNVSLVLSNTADTCY